LHHLQTATVCLQPNLISAATSRVSQPEQPLTLEDFQHFAKTIRQGQDDRLVQQVIDRWALTSVNALAAHFDGDAFLTKQSIRRALSAIDGAEQAQPVSSFELKALGFK
jgi:hypothetical protein